MTSGGCEDVAHERSVPRIRADGPDGKLHRHFDPEIGGRNAEMREHAHIAGQVDVAEGVRDGPALRGLVHDRIRIQRAAIAEIARLDVLAQAIGTHRRTREALCLAGAAAPAQEMRRAFRIDADEIGRDEARIGAGRFHVDGHRAGLRRCIIEHGGDASFDGTSRRRSSPPATKRLTAPARAQGSGQRNRPAANRREARSRPSSRVFSRHSWTNSVYRN